MNIFVPVKFEIIVLKGLKYILPLFALVLFASCSGNGDHTDEQNDLAADTIEVVDSLTYFQKQLMANPGNIEILMNRSQYFIRNGNIDNAEMDLASVLARDSSNLKAHKLYADIMMSKLEVEAGKYHYEYILERDSMNADALLGMGKLYALLDNPAKAMMNLNMALQANPYLAEAYFMKGIVYRSEFTKTGVEENLNRAISSFQTAIEQEPDYYSAYIELGVLYDQVDDEQALDYYNSALDIFPESLEAWYNKGMYFQNRGRVDEALACYQELHKIDSTWASPYYNEGYIHLIMTEQLDSAIYYFEKSVELDPNYFQAYNNMGLAYEKLGDFENARLNYTKAIEINPDFQLAKDNLNTLP